MDTYTALALSSPNDNISLLRKPVQNTPSLGLDTPALELITDFSRIPAICIPPTTQIDNALNQMIYSGVRLFFIVDRDFNILGSITSYDIQSEKPILHLQSRDCRIDTCSRDDITVQDIMTPVHRWRVLNYGVLPHAALGDIVETFRGLGQRHLIVVESMYGRNTQIVRGLFSTSTVERVLGINIDTAEPAKSFADIQHALA